MPKKSFTYIAPDSIETASDYLLMEKDASILAGGTDLLPRIKLGLTHPSCLVDLGRIRALKGIATREEGLFIGAMETLEDLVRNSNVSRYIPALGSSARSVGSSQIRNRATLVGNILQERRCLYLNQSEYWRKSIAPCFKVGGEVCHQRPRSRFCCALYYSDTAPVLLAYDAHVERYDGGTFRLTSLRDTILSHINGNSEKSLFTGILIRYPEPGTRARFIKQGVRAAMDFASLNAAVRYTPPGGEREPVLRIFVGACSSEPLELNETADFVIAHLSRLSEHIGEVKERALKELITKSSLVRETAISPKAKKSSFYLLSSLLEEFFSSPGLK